MMIFWKHGKTNEKVGAKKSRDDPEHKYMSTFPIVGIFK